MFAVVVYLPIAILLVAIVAMIVRAVRVTNATIAEAGLDAPDAKRRVVDQIRSRDVRCPRCGEQAFALLGQDGRWMCEADQCRTEFEGPEHVPAQAA